MLNRRARYPSTPSERPAATNSVRAIPKRPSAIETRKNGRAARRRRVMRFGSVQGPFTYVSTRSHGLARGADGVCDFLVRRTVHDEVPLHGRLSRLVCETNQVTREPASHVLER